MNISFKKAGMAILSNYVNFRAKVISRNKK